MPNYANRYARVSNRRRQRCYDVTMELLEALDEGEELAQDTIVSALNQRYPRKEWNTKTVGSLLVPLVSKGTINRVRKRVLGTMATYYSLCLFKYEETPTDTHGLDD